MDLVSPNQTETRRQPPRKPLGALDVVYFLPRLATRFLMPRLADRYVMGELLSPLAFGWSLFIVLFVLSVNLLKLAQLAARGARLDAITEMLGLRVVLASVYCLPMAMLLAGLLAFGRLSGDSELVAIQAGGIRNFRMLINALVLGLILSFVGLAMNEYVLPPAGRRLHVLEDQIKVELKGRIIEDLTDQKAFIVQDFEGGQLSRLVAAKRFEPADPPYPALMREVTYIQYNKGRVQTLVQATRAEWLGPDPKKPNVQHWKFIDADSQPMADVTNLQRWVIESQDMDLTLSKSPDQIRREMKDADQMNYAELSAYIQDLRQQHVRQRTIRELEVELEQKLAVPFAALVFALIGAPLGIRKQRSTAGFGIGLSLLIILAYYVGMSALSALGQNGQIEPLVAAWGCNGAGLLTGLVLTWRSS